MKEIIKETGPVTIAVLRLDEGDELITTLKKYAIENRINGAWFNLIGAGSQLKLTFFCPKDNTYIPTEAECPTIGEDLEATSIIGNIGWMDGKPIIHAHGDFSKRDFSTIGGHIFSFTTTATLEVKLEIFQGKITRAKHGKWNLNLMIKE